MTTADAAEQPIRLSELIKPKPKQQQLFEAMWVGCLTGDPEYLLFGGAAGPGKSYALRWGAVIFLLKCAKELGLRNVQVGLFSKDYPSLRDRHFNAVKAWPDWLGSFNESSHDYTLSPQYGSGVLSFRNLDAPEKYASAEFAAIFIEELTELERDTFEELRTRKRWPGVPNSPCVCVCNPRHKGLTWVRKLWIEHDFSGETDRALAAHNFWFLQALPQDNDSLPQSYYDTLASLGPTLRRALLEGDWYTVIGQAFPEFDRHVHVISTAEIPPQWRRIASHDWGYESPGHHLWGAVDPRGGVVIYRELSFRHLDPQEIAESILFHQGQDQPTVTWADPACWQERRRSDLSADQVAALAQAGRLQLSKADQYRQSGLYVQAANNSRIAGKGRIHTLLKDRGDGVPYLRIMDCCPVLVRTLQNIQLDRERNGEDVITEYLPEDDIRDDAYDALRYLLMGIPTSTAEQAERQPVLQYRWSTG